ncbi:hypothetical protein LTR62_002785 [Meristemomyces frigidus]|uniref:Bola-like protein n=1 Tax=Meristemomyces frigidus TaxID=1508187 RepID=A0AAN7TQE4_9PEZI|nr:hypothetical protein LTR62_002785 [Meristemomyces frigidus]
MLLPLARRSLQRQAFASARCIVPTETVQPLRRWYATEPATSVEAPDYLDENERKIFQTLKTELQPTKLEVQDISGGCGSMYALDIVSEHFKGLPVIKQHRLVNKVLEGDIKTWHGVQLKTKAP